jgi:hypothetical protein
MLSLIEEITGANAGIERPFPYLAVTATDLSGVYDAYEISCPDPDDLPPRLALSEEARDAAELLQNVLLDPKGLPDSAEFSINVGTEGIIRGQVKCTVKMHKEHPRFEFGFDSKSGNSPITRQIRDALQRNRDILSVYYMSGHCISAAGIHRPEIRDMPFLAWDFQDFSGYEVGREKPHDDHTQIHQLTGQPSDRSLFGWVVAHYRDGWLTCDDGSDEVADFVHLGEKGKLSLIHVKRSSNDAAERSSVSAEAYAAVATQAVKNIGYLSQEILYQWLSKPIFKDRATGTVSPD